MDINQNQTMPTMPGKPKAGKAIMWIIIALIVIIGGYFLIKGNIQPTSTEPIKIGFIGPLSGDGAAFGETERNATVLAVEEINKTGGIKGRELEIIYEDGKCNGKDATNAIQKLINIDKVKIVLGGTCSAETLAAAPIAESNKIILISAFSSNPALTDAGDYIFRNAPSDSDVAKVDAEVIAKSFGKVAIMTENTDYSQGVRTIMKKIFGDLGVTISSDEVYASAQNDFRTVILKIKQANPDVLYVNPGTSAKVAGLIIKQARELGLTVPIHGNFAIGTPDALATGGKYMEGIVFSDSSGLAERGKELLKDYKERFKADPANDYEMGAAYDRVYIIRNAITAVGYNPDKIKNYLYNLASFDGVIGTYHFDSNGDVVGVGFGEFTIKDGKKVPF